MELRIGRRYAALFQEELQHSDFTGGNKILQPGLVKGPWNVKEDQLLRKWVKENGPTRWSEATKVIKGRSGKQIRERWFNTLDPKLKKGNWGPEEEQILIQLVMKFGPKWSKLVGFFSGRTENSIKNRLY